jgi:penicillin-binding protein 1A
MDFKLLKNKKLLISIIYIGIGSVIFFPLLLITLISFNVFGELPTTDKLENPDAALATEIYSADGVLLGKFYNENRSPITYQQLSKNLVDALVATEDARFYEHSGIDFRGLARAFIKPLTLQGSAGGASTISQQLAKNLFGRPKFDSPIEKIIQKLKEWVIAVRLESFYTKEEILAMYLNTVDFGHNSYGIKSACRTYFDKSVNEVNVPEAALLIGLLQAPSRYNPKNFPFKAKTRRDIVISQMVKYDKLSFSEGLKYKNASINMDNFRAESHNDGEATYFREYIRKIAEKICQEKGIDLYTDGLKIYTTLDSRLQRYAEEATNVHLREMQKMLNKQFERQKPWAKNPEIIDADKKLY